MHAVAAGLDAGLERSRQRRLADRAKLPLGTSAAGSGSRSKVDRSLHSESRMDISGCPRRLETQDHGAEAQRRGRWSMAQTCQRTLQTVIVLVAATGMVACDSERSANPLSPNIAGPLAGITISAPTPVQPIDGRLIAVGDGPLTLTFQSAVSNSPRPFWYEAQVAQDGDFVSILYSFEEIPSVEAAVVTFELPEALDPERTYHWRVRALDGANTGPYSNGASFEIYTPVTIDAPTLALPPDGATTEIDAPALSVNNATVSGPASDITYRFEISLTASFAPVTATLSVPQSGGQTTTAQPGALGYNLTYYWRVHVRATGRTGQVDGPFSGTRSFRTPSVVIDTPAPVSPDGNETTPSTRPTYIIDNGAVTGPAGTVTYQVEVATDVGFVTVVDSPSAVRAGGAQTSVESQVDLDEDTVHYWRTRATTGTLTTAWSSTAVFRTPSSGGGGAADEIDLSQVVWLHENVSSWPKTSTVISTAIGNPPICINHTKLAQWPRADFSTSGRIVDSNAWVVANINGRWYAATWEWFLPGEICKQLGALDFMTHVGGLAPLNSWVPQSGERIGLMVSTPARHGNGPVNERSNVVLVTWP